MNITTGLAMKVLYSVESGGRVLQGLCCGSDFYVNHITVKFRHNGIRYNKFTYYTESLLFEKGSVIIAVPRPTQYNNITDRKDVLHCFTCTSRF